MAHGSLAGAIRQLREAVGQPGVGSESDAELLARFVARRDAAAFEQLVCRHDRMVRGVCRRVLRGAEDVEDVWQATFLTLARKAGEVGSVQSLGGWLYRVAYRMAIRVRADAVRRDRHERAVGGPTVTRDSDDPFQHAVQQDLSAIVGEEIDRLPEKYRTPVVLCYLEGKTNEEAALLLGCPAGTVVTWLARTRERLRVRLARRGVTIGASALIALLTRPGTGEAAPSAGWAATVRAAVAVADGHLTGAVVSHRVVSLITGACHAMSLNRFKLAAAALAALCLVGVGSGVLAGRLPDDGVRAGVRQPDAENPRAAGGGDLANAEEQKEKPAPQPGGAKNDPPATKPVRHKAEEVVNRSFKTGKSPTVVLELMNGRIDVVADSADAVTARVTKRSEAGTEDEAKEALKAIDLKLTQDQDQKQDVVRITAKQPNAEDHRRTHVGADAEVHVPPGAVLNLQTSNGAVNLTGGTGAVTIDTSNGAIVVKDGKGTLQLNTSNGAITVTGATGKIDLKTSNGPIDLMAEKAAVKARTSNGGVAFAGTLTDGPHLLTSTNGSIRLTLPADAQFKVAAMTSHGKVVNEFGPEPSGTAGRTMLNVTVGKDPKVEIGAQTSNGGIEIRKKKD
jgi:RNA polymerase sigma factor (sigma-70 family)